MACADLATGLILASLGPEGIQQLFRSPEGLVLQESLRLAPLLLGGVLAGAGQKHSFLLGFLVGLGNSAVCMLTQATLSLQASTLSWYGQPLSQALCGSLGAWLGATIWKPLVLTTAQAPRSAPPVRSPWPGAGRRCWPGRSSGSGLVWGLCWPWPGVSGPSSCCKPH